MSDSLWPHGLQHSRLPCPSLSPRVCSNSCPLSWDAIQTSHPLLSPSSRAFNLSQHQCFPMSWLFSSGGQSIGSFSFNICIHHSASFQLIFRINTCYWYMLHYEKSWNLYAKLKSSDTKQHIFCDSIWIISLEMSKQIHTDRKH